MQEKPISKALTEYATEVWLTLLGVGQHLELGETGNVHFAPEQASSHSTVWLEF